MVFLRDMERNLFLRVLFKNIYSIVFLRERNRRFLLGRGRRGGSEAESVGSLQGGVVGAEAKLNP
jgi:hypothetical protein